MIFSSSRLNRENLCHFPPSKRHWHAMMLNPIWCGTTTTQNSKHNHHHRAMMMTTMILFEMGRRNETRSEIFINPRHLAITQRSERARDNENINFDKILNSILPYPSSISRFSFSGAPFLRFVYISAVCYFFPLPFRALAARPQPDNSSFFAILIYTRTKREEKNIFQINIICFPLLNPLPHIYISLHRPPPTPQSNQEGHQFHSIPFILCNCIFDKRASKRKKRNDNEGKKYCNFPSNLPHFLFPLFLPPLHKPLLIILGIRVWNAPTAYLSCLYVSLPVSLPFFSPRCSLLRSFLIYSMIFWGWRK